MPAAAAKTAIAGQLRSPALVNILTVFPLTFCETIDIERNNLRLSAGAGARGLRIP